MLLCTVGLSAFRNRFYLFFKLLTAHLDIIETKLKNRNDNFLVHDLDKFIVNALKAFYKATGGKKPHAIIYYRDGLSEGQYDKAVKYEMTMLRDGIRSVEENMEIGITMLSVQRRHNVKFFCQNSKDTVGRCNNVPAGTVVDHDVTSGEHYDFYMYAHAGMMVS